HDLRGMGGWRCLLLCRWIGNRVMFGRYNRPTCRDVWLRARDTGALTMQKKSWVFGLIVLNASLGAALSTAVTVLADQNGQTDGVPRQIPYNGVLELDGQPVDATGEEAVQMRFSIYDGPAE